MAVEAARWQVQTKKCMVVVISRQARVACRKCRYSSERSTCCMQHAACKCMQKWQKACGISEGVSKGCCNAGREVERCSVIIKRVKGTSSYGDGCLVS